jgi:hypothetical protein
VRAQLTDGLFGNLFNTDRSAERTGSPEEAAPRAGEVGKWTDQPAKAADTVRAPCRALAHGSLRPPLPAGGRSTGMPVAAKSSPVQSTGYPVRSARAYVKRSPKLSAAGCLPLPYLRHPLIARAASSLHRWLPPRPAPYPALAGSVNLP